MSETAQRNRSMVSRGPAPALVRERRHAGTLLRWWRQQRRMSQLRLASDAAVSPRHLFYVESGRAVPSRELIIRLADHLRIPGHARNQILLAAGLAPAYAGDADDLDLLHAAARQVLLGHEPIPAIAVDGAWRLIAANTGWGLFTRDVADHLLVPPVNVLRLTLHPDGLAPRIVNLVEWRQNLLGRLQRRLTSLADPVLAELYAELCSYGGSERLVAAGERDNPLLPLRLRDGQRELTFCCTVTVFGTALDVTVPDLAIKAFYPQDGLTALALTAQPARSSRVSVLDSIVGLGADHGTMGVGADSE